MSLRGRLEGLVPATRRWETPSVVKLQRDAAIGRLAAIEADLLADMYSGGYCAYEERRAIEHQAAKDWLARLAAPVGVDTEVEAWRLICARSEAEDASSE